MLIFHTFGRQSVACHLTPIYASSSAGTLVIGMYSCLTHWGGDKMAPTLADDNLKCIFLNKDVGNLIKISLKFVSKGPMNNIPALVQIMVWCRPGHKPSSEPMMVRLPTYICVTRSQWVQLHVLWLDDTIQDGWWDRTRCSDTCCCVSELHASPTHISNKDVRMLFSKINS